LTPVKENDDSRAFAVTPQRSLHLIEELELKVKRSAPLFRAPAEAIAHGVQRLVDRRGVDVFLMEESHGWAGYVQRRLEVPVGVFLRGPYFLHRQITPLAKDKLINKDRERREGEALRLCAAALAPSKSVLDDTLRHYGVEGKRTHVAPNPMRVKPPVDPLLFDASPLPILFVGRFDTHKGGDIALEAFRLLVESGVEATLTMVGPDRGVPRRDGGRAGLDEALETLPEFVRGRIDYLGKLDKQEIDALRRKHPVAIAPSRYETFGNTVTEAMAAGACVVASAAGGVPEIVRDGETGLLVPPGSAAALAEALASLAANRETMRRLAVAARLHIETRFAPERIAGELVDFLEKMLAHWGRA
jgi:glycosyltransferase involved in cell wall biosynthesis